MTYCHWILFRLLFFLLKRVPFVKRWREWRDINSSVDWGKSWNTAVNFFEEREVYPEICVYAIQKYWLMVLYGDMSPVGLVRRVVTGILTHEHHEPYEPRWIFQQPKKHRKVRSKTARFIRLSPRKYGDLNTLLSWNVAGHRTLSFLRVRTSPAPG